MTSEQINAIDEVIKYLESEQEHFYNCDAKEREHHIYNFILVLKRMVYGNLSPCCDALVRPLNCEECSNPDHECIDVCVKCGAEVS